MITLPQEFDQRAEVALALLEKQPELRKAVWAEVNAFYQRHPGLERTEVGAAFVASILLSAWAEGSGSAGDSPASQQPRNQTAA